MHVNAINSFSNLNFEGRKEKKAAKKNSEIQYPQPQSSEGYMSKLSGPIAAALFLVPIATLPTSCDKIEVSAHAAVEIVYPPCPPNNDENTIDWDVQDSLLRWGNDYLAIPIDSVNGDYTDKALGYAEGKRQWEYDQPEYIELDVPSSTENETHYKHVVDNGLESDIKITKVNPGDVTIVKLDGTEDDYVGGLMFDEDGLKTFAHSNGKDSIYVYPKATSGENFNKYVQKGVVGRGYLDKQKYGENVLLVGFLSPGNETNPPTEDHYIEVSGKAITKDEIADILEGNKKSE